MSGEQASPQPARPIQSSDGSAITLPQPAQIVSGSYQPPLEGAGSQGGAGSGTNTVATVVAGESYQVKTTDVLVKADSSGAGAGVAAPVLTFPVFSNPGAWVGWKIVVFWFAWNGSQVPPQLAAGGSQKMSRVGGMQSSGELLSSTNLVTPGVSVTYEWDGAEFLQVA
jgi:hypothetical protein